MARATSMIIQIEIRAFMPSGTAWRGRRMLRECVLGPGAAFRWREAAASCGDRAALDAVRGRDLDLDIAVAASELVHLRGAHPHPQLAQVARDAALDADVVRLV